MGETKARRPRRSLEEVRAEKKADLERKIANAKASIEKWEKEIRALDIEYTKQDVSNITNAMREAGLTADDIVAMIKGDKK